MDNKRDDDDDDDGGGLAERRARQLKRNAKIVGDDATKSSLASNRPPRARTPGEMLARKQQLLGSNANSPGMMIIGGLQVASDSDANTNHNSPKLGQDLNQNPNLSWQDSGQDVEQAWQQPRQGSISSRQEAEVNGKEENARHQSRSQQQQQQQHQEQTQTTGERLESLTSELLKGNHFNGSSNNNNNNINLQRNIDMTPETDMTPATPTTTSSTNKNHDNYSHLQTLNGGEQMSIKTNGAGSIDDVYILLAKKDKDLQLAAELGKVLLERNEELSRANEKIAEEYSQKLEYLEQDKHKLKRKLDLLAGDYENRLIELQTDCNILKNQLDQQQQASRQMEKEKSKLIDDLVQQNQRLTNELAEATKSEELLSSQLEQVNDRIQSRLSNRQDHANQVDGLQEEIQILNQRKQDLERRLKAAQKDKVDLGAALEASGDKMLLMEDLLNDKEAKLDELALEVHDLRDSSSWLSGKLESMISLNERLINNLGSSSSTSIVQTNGRDSAADELIEIKTMSEHERSQIIEQLKELRLKNRSRMKANEMLKLIGDKRRQALDAQRRRRKLSSNSPDVEQLVEHNRTTTTTTGNNLHDELLSHSNSMTTSDGFELSSSAGQTPGDLLMKVFAMLRKFQVQLQHRKETIQVTGLAALGSGTGQGHHHLNTTTTTSTITNDDSGISTTIAEIEDKQFEDLDRWRQLIESLRSLIEELPCASCQLMIAERNEFEQLQKVHAKLADELRRKNEQISKLGAENIEASTKLAQSEQRSQLLASDLANCDKPKEEIVRLAWKARDEAVARKNAAEINLAKARIENMQISSQLMEVVQQKGELSQKLAQFEDDIHYFTQHSVRTKFDWEESVELERRRRDQTSRLNLLPSFGSNHSSPTRSGHNSINPIAILLNNFSSSSSSANRPNNYQSNNNNNNNNNSLEQQLAGDSGATHNHHQGVVVNQQQANGHQVGLVSQLTRNKFNLAKFWQKQSPQTTPSKSMNGNREES